MISFKVVYSSALMNEKAFPPLKSGNYSLSFFSRAFMFHFFNSSGTDLGISTPYCVYPSTELQTPLVKFSSQS